MRQITCLLLLLLIVSVVNITPCFATSIKIGYAVEDIAAQERLTFGSDPALTQMRTVIDIPQDYGKVVNIFQDGNTTVFWFEAGDGRLRDVRVQEKQPYVIRRSGKAE